MENKSREGKNGTHREKREGKTSKRVSCLPVSQCTPKSCYEKIKGLIFREKKSPNSNAILAPNLKMVDAPNYVQSPKDVYSSLVSCVFSQNKGLFTYFE